MSFKELIPEDIARITGGALEYFRGKPFWIHYEEMGARIHWRSTHPANTKPGEDSVTFLEIHRLNGVDEKYQLDNTVAVVRDGSITFVDAPYQHSQYLNDRRFSWVTISEKDGISSNVAVIKELGEPVGALDGYIRQAAYKAASGKNSR